MARPSARLVTQGPRGGPTLKRATLPPFAPKLGRPWRHPTECGVRPQGRPHRGEPGNTPRHAEYAPRIAHTMSCLIPYVLKIPWDVTRERAVRPCSPQPGNSMSYARTASNVWAAAASYTWEKTIKSTKRLQEGGVQTQDHQGNKYEVNAQAM